MPDYVRARNKNTGAHVTITKAKADRHKDIYEVLVGKPATDKLGRPLPPKPRTTPAPEATPTTPRAAAKPKES